MQIIGIAFSNKLIVYLFTLYNNESVNIPKSLSESIIIFPLYSINANSKKNSDKILIQYSFL